MSIKQPITRTQNAPLRIVTLFNHNLSFIPVYNIHYYQIILCIKLSNSLAYPPGTKYVQAPL